MFDDCPVCGLHFEIEPGFFWGAMYVSYAMTVAMMITVGAAVLLISSGQADFWGYIIPIFSCMFFAVPFTYRYARVLMIHWFSQIQFEKEFVKKK